MFTIFGFYKFNKFTHLRKNQKILNNILINNNLSGLIIISKEGLNGSISGKNHDIKNYITELKNIFVIKNIEVFLIYNLFCA